MMNTQEERHREQAMMAAPIKLTIIKTVFVVFIAATVAALLHVYISHYFNTIWYDITVAAVISAIISPIFLYPSYRAAHRLRRANAIILEQARTDHLTKLPNYFALGEEIRARLSEHQSDEGLAVHFIDLNAFKHVNDSLGHDFGNELLAEVADALRQALAGKAFLARFAGDEFVIVQSVSGSIADAKGLVAQVRQDVVKAYELRGHRVHVDITVGTAISPFHATQATDLLKAAELALYHAKKCGLATALYNPDLARDANRIHELEAALHSALDLDQFFVLYQPIVDAGHTGRITSIEALLRWRMADDSLVSPAEFIPAAERTGEIVTVGEWVLDQACRQCASWPEDVSVSVNVSPVQFFRSDIISTVQRVLHDTGLAARRLTLEITETALISDTKQLEPILAELRGMGVSLALDDFGAGFCGLNYLRGLDIDKLKIDKTIIDQAFHDNKSFSVLKGVATIARQNRVCIVVEGVDNPSKERLVRDHHIADELQGFLYFQPMYAPDVSRLLVPSGQVGERVAGSTVADEKLPLH